MSRVNSQEGATRENTPGVPSRHPTPQMQGPAPQNPLTRSPLPGPDPEAFTKAAELKKSTSVRKPAGLQLQWPPMESVLRGDYAQRQGSHKRTKSTAITQSGRRPSDEMMQLDDTGRMRSASAVRRVRVESPGPVRGDERGRRVERDDVYARSPSSPLPLSPGTAYEAQDKFEDNVLNIRENMYRDRSRGRRGNSISREEREGSRMREGSRRRGGSRVRDADRGEDDYDDERYYVASRSRGRGRSSSRRAITPPTPPDVPMSADSHFYRRGRDGHSEDEEEYSDEYERRREPRGRSRNASARREVRRSRSETTLNRWADEGLRSRNVSRRPSDVNYYEEEEERRPRHTRRPSVADPVRRVGSQMRMQSPAGLPATPKAWRGLSPAPGRNQSPMPPMPRSASRLRSSSAVRDELPQQPFSAGPTVYRAPPNSGNVGLPVGPGVMKGMHYYMDDENVPAVPPIPDSHSRNNSVTKEVEEAPKIRNPNGIIPVPKPVIPPGSPPPLPIDFPMHAAVNLNIKPSTPNALARKMSVSNNGRPARRGTVGNEERVTVALDDAQLHQQWTERELSPKRGRRADLRAQAAAEGREVSPAPSMSSGIISIEMNAKCVEEELRSGRMTPKHIDARKMGMAMI